MDHHEVFREFRPQRPEIPDGCVQDSFLGTVRRDYVLQIDGYSDQDQDFGDYPRFDEEYYEWIDLLESVGAADGSYTFMELGAGFGRWAIRAGFAAVQRGGLDVKLVAAEPEHTHYLWMEDHFILNGFKPQDHWLIESVVNDVGGTVSFTIADESVSSQPDKWYGQAMVGGWRVAARKAVGALSPKRAPRWNVAKVPAMSLTTVLEKCELVDLADLDVQGAELIILEAGIARVNSQIRRLHLGTHSTAIEVGLRKLMSTNRWECLADWPGRQANETPYGTSDFGDGAQTWLNPRLT
jgi:FkbM family methyltransferase